MSQYAALRANVGLLGTQLGDTIRNQLGDAVLERIEQIRALAKEARQGTELQDQQLKQVRSDIDYKIATLTEGRDEMLRQKAMFFVPPVVIAVFLLLMVSFGLFGVLWQNVNSRIPELGLRRAIGASTAQIYGQIVTEQVLISSLAMAVGMLFLIQLPFAGIFAKFMDWNSFFSSIAQASASLIGVILAFIISRILSEVTDYDILRKECDDILIQVKQLRIEIKSIDFQWHDRKCAAGT